MSRELGWIGFFFIILSGFLPIVSVEVFGFNVESPSPFGLIIHFISSPGDLSKISTSPVFPSLTFGFLVFYPLTVIISLYGLNYRRRRFVRYSGFMGLVSTILAYLIAYNITSVKGVSVGGTEYAVYTLLIGSILLLVSAQR
ncbi:MAG: hypothetical protein PWQ22_530 [Archaeoglobaceae archaeon]|nr:hypothetical protein [Archaeoglobaceae archaeon]MDK2876120.1 hypothetical protein [Archaeoglobaceae archaeon]